MPESESPHETVEETEERRVEQEMEVEEEPLELVTRKREPGMMMQHSSQPCEQCSARKHLNDTRRSQHRHFDVQQIRHGGVLIQI